MSGWQKYAFMLGILTTHRERIYPSIRWDYPTCLQGMVYPGGHKMSKSTFKNGSKFTVARKYLYALSMKFGYYCCRQ